MLRIIPPTKKIVHFSSFFFGLVFFRFFPTFISSCGFGGIRPRAAIRRFVASISLESFAMSKAPMLNFPVRDLKLEAIARLAQEDWDIPKLRNPSLELVATSFRSNIAIARFMMSLPTTIVGAMAKTQRAHDLAEFQVTAQLGGAVSLENQKRADARAKEILEDELQGDIKRRERDDWDKYVLEYHLGAAKALSGLTETP